MTEHPQLATCSYSEYRRDMGTAVRITLSAPRFIRLPNPRYTKYAKWPHIAELAPKRDYFKAPPDVFIAKYLSQLDRFAGDIERKLTWIEPEYGRLCLLCFEKNVTDAYDPGPGGCHRRLFAQWWAERTGDRVPELGGRR